MNTERCRPRTVTAPLVLLLLALASGACGTGAQPPREGASRAETQEVQAYVEVVARTAPGRPTGISVLTAEQQRCTAIAAARALGATRLREAGMTPERLLDAAGALAYTELDLGHDEASMLLEAYGRCDVDARSIVWARVANDSEPPSPSIQRCIADALPEPALEAMAVAIMTEGTGAIDDDADGMAASIDLLSCAILDLDETLEQTVD